MWILDNGIWLDVGIWDDADFWQDYPAETGTLAATEAPDTASFVGLTETAPEPPLPSGGGAVRPRRRKPAPVEGFGFGVLPPLQGEAFGVVGVAGTAVAQLSGLGIVGNGAAGASGHSQAQLTIKAVGVGDRGSVGTAAGQVATIKGAGMAHHDDDEAVAIRFLLDA